MLKDIFCRLFLLLFFLASTLMCHIQSSRAAIPIITDPEINMESGEFPQELGKLKLRVVSNTANLNFLWKIEKGPGELSGNKDLSNALYLPPKQTIQDKVKVIISVEVTTDKGYKDTGKIQFDLIPSPPEPLPAATQSSTPTKESNSFKYTAAGVGGVVVIGGGVLIGSGGGGGGNGKTETSIRINTPNENSKVNWTSAVYGHATGFEGDDYVTISIQPHGFDWFPQSSRGSIDSNGNWIVENCYFGLEGDIDKGRAFRFQAELRSHNDEIKAADTINTVIRN